MTDTMNFRALFREIAMLGVWQTIRFRWQARGRGQFRLQPRGFRHPICLRGGTTDSWVFSQVVLAGEYSLVPSELRPLRIVDAGANAGFAALYFLRRWPEVQVVCIEPDPENYELAVENLAPYPNASVLRAALAGRDGKVGIVEPSDWKYAIRVEASEHGCIPALSMQSVMERAGWDGCDLVKIDIEGGELDLFSSGDPSWIDKVKGMVLELHETIAPGCTSALFGALQGRRFTLSWRGENLFIGFVGKAANASIPE